MYRIRKLLSALLVMALMCSLLLPALAAESDRETEPVSAAETMEPEGTSEPAETTEPEEPSEPAETTEPVETSEPEETTEPEETEPEETGPTFSAPYTPYFGLLHSHTSVSSGEGTVAEAYAYARDIAGLDFLAVTDTSHCFDDHMNASIDRDASSHSKTWAEGVAAAEAAATEEFAAIFGYEMSWPEGRRLGHVITFNTPGFQSSLQEPYAEGSRALEEYYKTLTKVPESISILCHPGSHYGNFRSFGSYEAAYDSRIHLLEVTDEMGPAFGQYDQALAAGWHVAPSASQNNHYDNWGTANGDRTVILAEKLTRESLFEAICSHRVYATRDPDLHLYYTLNGEPMGSVLPSVEDPEICVTVYDPTDGALGTVEVIGEDGEVLDSQAVTGNSGELTLSVSGRHRYYYLRVTQPDGDIAVTAPVWMENFEDMGISALTCDTRVPVQGEPVTLELSLYNDEPVDLVITSLEVRWEGSAVWRKEEPGTVFARDTLVLTVPYTHPEAGSVQLEVAVTGTVEGEERHYSEYISLKYRTAETVTGILVDGSHGYPDLSRLTGAVSLGEEADMTVTLFAEEMPQGGSILIIPGLNSPASDAFLADVADFVEKGGVLILWPGSETGENENRLLEAVGSNLRFGAAAEGGSCTAFNKKQPWCAGLTKNQFFSHKDGFSIEPGSGVWLVKTGEEQTVLAWEDLGGGIFAAGSAFLEDEALSLSESVWDIPRANESIFRNILDAARTVVECSDIRDVRRGTVGAVYRVKGYVTAGTSNPKTIFPNTIYLQDNSGGIAVTGYTAADLPIGKPMEIIGVLQAENGNPVLSITNFRFPEEQAHRYSPDVMTCENATNYLAHGGEVVAIQGKITKQTLTSDKKGLAALSVKDSAGDTAEVIIEKTVFSGSTGKNTLASKLKTGRTVRVIGILHLNEAGDPVIRVRDCDEVTYIKDPKKADPSNPKTGDFFGFLWFLRK